MITARAIIEMIGAPKEHLTSTLQGYVDKWKEEGVKIKTEHFEDPKEEGKLWRTFVELEIDFENTMELMGFCLDALPASLDVIDPETLQIKAHDITAIMNDMLSRLHEADMLVKNIRSQMSLLDKNVMNTFRNFIRYACKEPKTLDEITQLLGVGEKELKPFLDKMVEENLLSVDGQRYAVNG